MQETQLSLSSSVCRRNTQCCNREREKEGGEEKEGEGVGEKRKARKC